MALRTTPSQHTHMYTSRSCSYRAARPWWEACFQRDTESWGALQSEELKHTHRALLLLSDIKHLWWSTHCLPLSAHTFVIGWVNSSISPSTSQQELSWSPQCSRFCSSWLLYPYPSILPTSLSLQIFLSPCGHDAPNSSSFPSSQRCVRVSLSLVIMLTVFVQLAFLKHRIAVGNTTHTISLWLHTCAFAFSFM